MTTERIAEKLVKDMKRRSPKEKAKLRRILNKAFGPSAMREKMSGLAAAARQVAYEERQLRLFRDMNSKDKAIN